MPEYDINQRNLCCNESYKPLYLHNSGHKSQELAVFPCSWVLNLKLNRERANGWMR